MAHYLMGIGSGAGVLSSGERVVFSLLKQIKLPPYCIFDVGSNHGQFLDLTLECLGDVDCNIHCFEPGRHTFEILAARRSECSKIVLNNFGIGGKSCDATLHYDSAGSGLASLSRRDLRHLNIEFDKSEQIRIDTIDSYCAKNSIAHIDLLKIDIEGHELDALGGSAEMIKNNCVDIVAFEFGGCNVDSRTHFRDFWDYFNDADFSLFRITPSGYLRPMRKYRESDEQYRTTNYVATANRLKNLNGERLVP